MQLQPFSHPQHEGQPLWLRPRVKLTSSQFTSVIALVATVSAVLATPLDERSGTKLTQAQAASRIAAAGISTSSSGGCTDKTKPNCTSLDGIYSGTIDGVITLKSASGASITITGGTETGAGVNGFAA